MTSASETLLGFLVEDDFDTVSSTEEKEEYLGRLKQEWEGRFLTRAEVEDHGRDTDSGDAEDGVDDVRR